MQTETGITNDLRHSPQKSAQLIELSELSNDSTRHGDPVSQSLNPLHQVKAQLQVCVGSAVLTVGELLGAKVHQVLVLDRGVQQPVDLILEGQVVARGQLVAVDDQFAVRITELPLQLGLQNLHAQ
jgi:flagellar motor switch protein FliN/FliY